MASYTVLPAAPPSGFAAGFSNSFSNSSDKMSSLLMEALMKKKLQEAEKSKNQGVYDKAVQSGGYDEEIKYNDKTGELERILKTKKNKQNDLSPSEYGTALKQATIRARDPMPFASAAGLPEYDPIQKMTGMGSGDLSQFLGTPEISQPDITSSALKESLFPQYTPDQIKADAMGMPEKKQSILDILNANENQDTSLDTANDFIDVVLPNGETGKIPRSNLQEAIKRGARVAQ